MVRRHERQAPLPATLALWPPLLPSTHTATSASAACQDRRGAGLSDDGGVTALGAVEEGQHGVDGVVEVGDLRAGNTSASVDAAMVGDPSNSFGIGNGAGISRPSTMRSSFGGPDGGFGAFGPADSARRCTDRPSPRSRRPGCRASMVAKASTAATGVVNPISTAADPTRMVEVFAATRPTSVAGDAPATAAKWCSASQYRRYPHCSAATARSIVVRRACAAVPPSGMGDRSRTTAGAARQRSPDHV